MCWFFGRCSRFDYSEAMRRAVPTSLLAGVLCACGAPAPTDGLLNVADFGPRRVEVGDRMEVIGSSFPEGKPATVTFRGDVFRPGQAPERNVEIVATATSSSQNRITFFLTDEIQSRFCSKGELADHATFRGDVIAALAPRTSAAPPVTGTVRNVEIDFPGPAVPKELRARREAEGKAAAEFIGVRFEKNGFRVDAVAPSGPAERAGILPGDVIESVEGVRVRRTSDLAFSGVERWAKVEVRRGPDKQMIERRVDVQGFRPATPRDLASAAVVVGIGVAVLLFSLGPLAKLSAFFARRIASRLRAKNEKPKSIWSRLAELSQMESDRAPALLRVVPYLLFLAVSAGATTISFGRALVASDLDLGLVLSSSLTLLVLVAVMAGGWHGPRRWSIVAGMKSGLYVLSCQIPILFALASIVVCTGNVRLADIVAEQGVLPWHWNAFKNPVAFLALLLLIGAAVPRAARQTGILRDADLPVDDRREGLLAHLEWGHLLVLSTLAAMLFLGGWRTPQAIAVAGPVWAAATSALVLQVKSWLLLATILVLRWAVKELSADQIGSMWWRWALPLSLLVVGASVAWASWIPVAFSRSVENGLGYVLFVATASCLLVFARRVKMDAARSNAAYSVNPWL
jgi:NADH-quinone oxidoreductase subunit H